MTSRAVRLVRPLFWLVFAFLSGCEASQEDLYPVRGRITYKNEPVRGGTVLFTPDPLRGNFGPVAGGSISPDGTYEIHTGARTGAASGWYRVTISAREPTAELEQSHAWQNTADELPEKYRDPELSGLVCEVRATQANQLDFNLE